MYIKPHFIIQTDRRGGPAAGKAGGETGTGPAGAHDPRHAALGPDTLWGGRTR